MRSELLTNIIRIASNVSLAIPLVIYLMRFKYATRRIHIIGILVIVSGISDLIGYILSSDQQSTVVLLNTYFAVLFFLLTWFYYDILFLNNRRMMIWIGLAIYLQSFILTTLFVQSYLEYQTLMWVITAIIMIIYGIAYFFYSFSTIPMSNVFGYSFIWINSGVLIYFCLCLFLFTVGDYALTQLDTKTSAMVWSFHNVSNLLKNILFAIGIYLHKRKIAEF